MFDNHFEVYLANTQESKNIHYNIRYQVYCEEMGFENEKDFPQQMEFDDDDAKSIHFIVRNNVTGQWVGAMRLIKKQDELLPMERFCRLNEKISNNDLFKMVEISRLCLIKEVRRGNPPIGEEEMSQLSELKLNRLIIWGLFYAAVKYGYKNRINSSYFMTTKALARVLKRSGLNLINIGSSCQHNGERFPFKMNTHEVYTSNVWENKCSKGYSLYSELEAIAA